MTELVHQDQRPLTHKEYWAIVDLIAAANEAIQEAKIGRRVTRIPNYIIDDLRSALEDL